MEARAAAVGTPVVRTDAAALWAGELFEMYRRLAERHRWKTDVLASSPADLGGFKEVSLEVRDQYAYTLLMASDRDTLPRAFRRRGYRSVALMPGMRQMWPEGAFYGIDEIYGLLRSSRWDDAAALYERESTREEKAAPEFRLAYAIALLRTGRESSARALRGLRSPGPC